jgi:serine/threonine protein kinase
MQEVVWVEDARSTTPTLKNPPLLAVEERVLGGRYRILRLIGRGGMADVFLGDDLLLERTVAIKVMHAHLADDSSGLERVRREAMTLAAVRSPNVVGIYDIGFDGSVFLVMQHLEGHTIEDEIARTGPMSEARATGVLAQLLDGLVEIHALGLVHRDIKPSNIILGGGDHVVLLDLGIALDVRRAPLTAPGMVAGTPGYLAPESCTCETDYASDVYQVGLIMLFLLTGVDFGRQSPARSVEDLLSRLPASLRGMARRALATDPSERFPSALVMREALDNPPEVPPPPPPPLPSAKDERRRTRRGVQAPLTKRDSAATTVLLPTVLLPTVLLPAQILAPPQTVYLGGIRLPIVQLAKLRRRILIVDEDVAFSRTLHRMLKAHDALIVNTPSQALAHLEGGARVDVILCGLMAPMEFHAGMIQRCSEQVPVTIFLTETRASKEVCAHTDKITNRCLGKPFELDLLEELIDDCIGSRPLATI